MVSKSENPCDQLRNPNSEWQGDPDFTLYSRREECAIFELELFVKLILTKAKRNLGRYYILAALDGLENNIFCFQKIRVPNFSIRNLVSPILKSPFRTTVRSQINSCLDAMNIRFFYQDHTSRTIYSVGFNYSTTRCDLSFYIDIIMYQSQRICNNHVP